MKFSRGKIILILLLMSVSVGMLLYSFAYTTVSHTGSDSNYLAVSDISFGFTDSVSSLDLGEQIPTIDKFGLLNEVFKFRVTNTSTKTQFYTIRLVDGQTISTIDNTDVRYQLTVDEVVGEPKGLSESGVIYSGEIFASETIFFSIRLWLKYDASTTEGVWDKIVKVEAGMTNIDISGANEPVLVDGMIPVYYKNGSWYKADSNNADALYQWYDYDARMWANAVMVKETNRETYLSDTISPLGTEILMDDILAFYVWIPRFKYDLFENGAAKEVNVTFETSVKSTGDMTCSFEGGVQSCQTGTSYTHPAFEFNGEPLSGFWVSKFEVSPESSTTCYTNTNSSNCDIANLQLLSKPNQKSLYYIKLANLFKSIRSMELSGNIYGFTNGGTVLNSDGTIEDDNNEFDVHLTKSFENGALAYLTYSKYGKYTNPLFDGNNKEVFSNLTSNKTGASVLNNITYEYDVEYYGTGASTTGNVYGVYDLNGSIGEFIMLNVFNSSTSTTLNTSSSGFTTDLDSRYYETYAYASNTSNFKSFYGDGIREFEGFSNNNSSNKPYYSNPFAYKKSLDTIYYTKGGSTANVGGRIVITASQDVYITEW